MGGEIWCVGWRILDSQNWEAAEAAIWGYGLAHVVTTMNRGVNTICLFVILMNWDADTICLFVILMNRDADTT